MRTVLILTVACSFLAGSVHRAHAQGERPGPGPVAIPESYLREQKHAQTLVSIYLSTGSTTVEKEAAEALKKIGSPAVLPLEQKLEETWKEYLVNRNPEHLKKNVTKIAKLLGKFGVPLGAMGSYPEPDNPARLVRDKVRRTLIEIAKFSDPEIEARQRVSGPEIEARRAAIEALGIIHSQKAPYLIINYPEFLRNFDNTKDLAKELRRQAQNLKAKFVQHAPKKDPLEAPKKDPVVDPPDPGTIAKILLDARNLQRVFHSRSNRKVLIFFSELEPAGKESGLKERCELALAGLENNLRIAASGYDAEKKEPNASHEYIKSVKRDAWLKANRNAFDLCEDMEYLVADIISEKWQDELNQVHEVLDAFHNILEGESRLDGESKLASRFSVIRFSVLQATRRMYAGDE